VLGVCARSSFPLEEVMTRSGGGLLGWLYMGVKDRTVVMYTSRNVSARRISPGLFLYIFPAKRRHLST